MPQDCTWLFGRGASIANGLPWVVPQQWKEDVARGRINREPHIEMIANTLREEMDKSSVHSESYRRLIETMAARTVVKGHHRFMTTNWDYLLQRELDSWVDANCPGWAPKFLSTHGTVYHFNGSVQLGNFQNRSPLLLETDSAEFRQSTFEANHAFELLLWSTLVVIVGMSFECSIDRGLLAALRANEDNLPIGSALFIIVEPTIENLDQSYSILANCFPRADGIRVQKGFGEWVNEGMPELSGRIFI